MDDLPNGEGDPPEDGASHRGTGSLVQFGVRIADRLLQPCHRLGPLALEMQFRGFEDNNEIPVFGKTNVWEPGRDQVSGHDKLVTDVPGVVRRGFRSLVTL